MGETSLQNKKDNKKDDEEELPQSAFPYHKHLLFGTDHHDKVPFDCTDKSIHFICHNLNCHGLGFLLCKDLGEIQLDLLMIASWSILQQIHGKQSHHSWRQHARCNYIEQFPIKRLTFQKERLKELQSTNTHSFWVCTKAP